MLEQLKLFEEEYRSLEELRTIISHLHWTGGITNGEMIYTEYKLDFYKDLAFITEFRKETDNNEKIIDNCIVLEQVEDDLYRIIRIDGKSLGEIEKEYPDKVEIQLSIIESMMKGELFKI